MVELVPRSQEEVPMPNGHTAMHQQSADIADVPEDFGRLVSDPGWVLRGQVFMPSGQLRLGYRDLDDLRVMGVMDAVRAKVGQSVQVAATPLSDLKPEVSRSRLELHADGGWQGRRHVDSRRLVVNKPPILRRIHSIVASSQVR